MKVLSPSSYWLQDPRSTSALTFQPLESDKRVDVAVIGAGITGLTAALHLKHAGKQVAVVEADRVGGAGTTVMSSGHLDVMPDQGFVKLISAWGEDAAREITEARAQAINQIERWSDEFGIDCDFRRIHAMTYTEQKDHAQDIQAEYDAAHLLGIDASTRSGAGLPFPTAFAMEIPHQARFDAVKYLRGLARAFHGEQSTIYESTMAKPPEDRSPSVVQANGHRITATDVVLATHSAFLGISHFDVRQAAYQSYILAVRVEDDVPDALFWDDEQPYHYTRVAASDDPRLLIIGGADHKTGQGNPRERLRQLEEFVRRRFNVVEIELRWSAELFEPADGLPFIGRVPGSDHLFIAAGFSGTGLTYGTVAGKMLADLILHRRSQYEDLFSPARLKPLAAAKDFLRENLNAAKHFVADRFTADEVESLDVVACGEGRLVKLDGEVYAVYRDQQNRLHQLSPVCTHAGCYVQWNSFEKTWDCPCHGGRYLATGERLYGPPAANLERSS